ncbi:class I SAM-dependent methyltransferase [Bradyrhizobium sp. 1]|uniref:class I SAM-dependent methyltransferase n=1 Tax=Bradyrhizobium sp. 1 TaxID=241591 RepID=UPI001FFB96D2|nr:class I SAM-dependent methyltransferase [Bradyrhizobium sp. 1]MCK1393559.1 class I SAM-dependent methyltransferase [Bradyrhizobium sp. 1]
MIKNAMQCSVCGADQWQAIPDPLPNRSITTAGVLLKQPLAKAQCGACGLLQRANADFVGNSDYYENRYADYYLRAGAEIYDAPRYRVMAEWMRAGLGNFRPQSILDVGCGAGWMMRATLEQFPDAEIEGIEPSTINTERARKEGFKVGRGKIGEAATSKQTFDLVYANNVLQHVSSPIEFLTALHGYLSSDSLLVLTCPDATRPSCEMLCTDHNHSFRPEDLVALANKTGYVVHAWLPNPGNNAVLDKQLVVFSKRGRAHAGVGRPGIAALTLPQLLTARRDYIEQWRSLDGKLCAQIEGAARTFNFGSSSWTWFLAGYCPEYWRRVDCCVVDRFSGRCLDKAVKPLGEIAADAADRLVLGVNPVTQASFAERFAAEGRAVIRWDEVVQS